MVAAVAITRKDYTAEQLRELAKRTKDAGAARRMLALALVLEGKSRSEAATSCGMDRQILCDWAHRYNAAGIAGLGVGAGRQVTQRGGAILRHGPSKSMRL